MVRISALSGAPIFAVSAFNVRLRVLLALVLTFNLSPLHGPLWIPSARRACVRCLFKPAWRGHGPRAADRYRGGGGRWQAISASMGLSMANMIDPNLGNVPVIAQFLLVIATLLFLARRHLVLISILLESFRTLPIGDAESIGLFLVLEWSAMIFLGGVTLALPILAVMLCVNVGMGIITRAAPSLNVFAVGFPALLLVGLGILLVALPTLVFRIEGLWLQGFQQLRTLAGLG